MSFWKKLFGVRSASFLEAAWEGDLKKVKELIEGNPDLIFSKDDKGGYTPLHWAVSGGHKDVAELLLTNQAEVNAKANDGTTPLHWAAKNGHTAVAALLLANQAEVVARDKDGWTPLQWAVAKGRKDVAELLRKHGGPTVSLRRPPTTYAAPTQKTDPPNILGTSYVEAVFSFDLVNKPESRDWREIDRLRLVPDLMNGFGRKKDICQAEAIIGDALGNFPDYSFVHTWQATVYEEKGDIPRARQAYIDGIRVSNEKHGLCGGLAMLEFNHATLKEAVKWWIRSIILQMPSKSVDYATSFLYLAFVAYLYQLNDASEKLMDASSRGMHGKIDLSPEGKQKVSRKVNAEQSAEIASAIRELTTRRWTNF